MTTTNALPVFDPAQLKRQTRGDVTLQVEMLSLFVAEVERLMRQVEDASDAQIRGERLRALISVARNVGAAKLAQSARSVETQIGGDQPDLAPLRSVVSETLAFVQHSSA